MTISNKLYILKTYRPNLWLLSQLIDITIIGTLSALLVNNSNWFIIIPIQILLNLAIVYFYQVKKFN